MFGLLLVCTCAYLRKVPRLRTWLLSERRGIWGVCHKGEGHCGHWNMGRGCWEHWDEGTWNSGVQDEDAGIAGVGSGTGVLSPGWGHTDLGWGHRQRSGMGVLRCGLGTQGYWKWEQWGLGWEHGVWDGLMGIQDGSGTGTRGLTPPCPTCSCCDWDPSACGCVRVLSSHGLLRPCGKVTT